MEFLLGRALANNISNLLIDPAVQQFCQRHQLDPLQIIEQEPDAGLGNGGLGRLAACFLDSMATLGIAGMGYGLRYDYGIFRQSIHDGWQAEQPDDWLARPNEAVEVKLNVSFVARTFGYLTAVQEASSVLDRAHTVARSVQNGIALVKVMGRNAGFIAVGATVASQEVNFCLIP